MRSGAQCYRNRRNGIGPLSRQSVGRGFEPRPPYKQPDERLFLSRERTGSEIKDSRRQTRFRHSADEQGSGIGDGRGGLHRRAGPTRQSRCADLRRVRHRPRRTRLQGGHRDTAGLNVHATTTAQRHGLPTRHP